MSVAADMDEEEEDFVCPLLEEVGIMVSAISALKIFRVEKDEDGKELPVGFQCSLPPTSTIDDLADACGGGTYDIRAFGQNRRWIKTGVRVKIEGDRRGAKKKAAADPVVETATGLASIRDLDTVSQAVLVLCQQHTAAIREDAHRYADSLTALVAEFVKKAEPPAPPSNEKFLLAQLDRLAKENDAARASGKATSVESLKLDVKKMELDAATGTTTKLIEKLTDLLDPVANLAIGYMVNKHGLALPTTAGPAADAARAALEAGAEALK